MTPATVYALYLLFALGGLALYLLMPCEGKKRTMAGAALGIPALIGFFVLLSFDRAGTSNVLFYVFGAIALFGGVRVVTHPKPVYSAIYFVLVVVATSAILILQSAEFLAVALLIIYAGAILVTYLFVIMLAQQPTPPLYDRSAREPLLGILMGFVLVALIAGRAAQYESPEAPRSQVTTVSDPNLQAGPGGNTLSLGAILMTRYVVVLELSGILLLVSMVGAIALSRKKIALPAEWPQQQLGRIGREVEPF